VTSSYLGRGRPIPMRRSLAAGPLLAPHTHSEDYSYPHRFGVCCPRLRPVSPRLRYATDHDCCHAHQPLRLYYTGGDQPKEWVAAGMGDGPLAAGPSRVAANDLPSQVVPLVLQLAPRLAEPTREPVGWDFAGVERVPSANRLRQDASEVGRVRDHGILNRAKPE
jgi:hypothetical protein